MVDELHQVHVGLVVAFEDVDGFERVDVPEVDRWGVAFFARGDHGSLRDGETHDFVCVFVVVFLFVELDVEDDDDFRCDVEQLLAGAFVGVSG